MLPYESRVGARTDWANTVTNVEDGQTPVLSWLRSGPDVRQMTCHYQAEVYADPVANAHVDGQPVTNYAAAGANRGELVSVGQYSTKTASITKLHRDFGDIAGVADDLAHEMTKKMTELRRDIEAKILSDSACVVGSGSTAYETRGIPSWIATSAQATYPVPSAVRPPSASIDTTATANLTEEIVLGILGSMGSVTKRKDMVTCISGYSFKRACNAFPQFVSGSALTTSGTLNAGAYPRTRTDGVFSRLITVYDTDYGPVEFMPTYYLDYLGSTATYKSHGALFLHQNMWDFAWGERPSWNMPPYLGGSYSAFTECVWRVSCKNPRGEGKYWPAT